MFSLRPPQRHAVTRLSDLDPVLPSGTLDAWPKVAAVLPESAMLMGGTGIAVWLRHCRSEDLEFFVAETFDSDALSSALAEVGDFFAMTCTSRTITAMFDVTKIDIVARPDDHQIGPHATVDGLRVGSLQDIAASKYNAIATGKQLRDYHDAMVIEQRGKIRLEQGILLYLDKHGMKRDVNNARRFVQQMTDLTFVPDDPAVRTAYRDQVHATVAAFFRRRVPEVVAALTQTLEPADDPWPDPSQVAGPGAPAPSAPLPHVGLGS